MPRAPVRGSNAGMHEIQIRLSNLSQLFDSLDPSPFREKALDRNAEAYLIESVAEWPGHTPLAVAIHGPEALAPHLPDMGEAIHAHFAVLADSARRRQRQRHRRARLAMLLGTVGLALGLGLRTLAQQWPGPIGEFLAEGFLILAWVALWRPAEIVLFDRWEQREELRVLELLAQVPVSFCALT